MVAQVGYLVVGRSRGRVSLYVICTVHVETRNVGFLSGASTPRSTVCQWIDLKTTGTCFFGLASKPVAMGFSSLASKPVATVFLGLASGGGFLS
jgi:hypothetical protein